MQTQLMQNQRQVEQIVQQVAQWAGFNRLILAAALVGSQARGTAHDESDIDLMLLTRQPLLFRRSTNWLSEIHWGHRRIESWKDKDYGAVWSRHVHLNDEIGHTEVELSFGHTDWASTNPLDSGTQRVIRDGCHILYDPEERLTQLVLVVSQRS